MKKMTNEKLTAVNGGWAKFTDRWLPIDNYKRGDIRQYVGSHDGIAYIVYYRPSKGYRFRTA